MKTAVTSIACIIGFFVLVFGIGFLVEGGDLLTYKFFAPKQEAVRREVFEKTRSFNQGMTQELENMQFDYLKEKDPNAKAALGSIILHRASGYNMEDAGVPDSLRNFVETLKNNR
jgi:hypothetical protein